MPPAVIDVALDFSRFPAGRKSTDGDFSGETFRKRLLEPAFATAQEKVVVKLDGTFGYGSSFLEEAFGGLVRSSKQSPEEVLARLDLQSEDASLIDEIRDYIRNAR